jgi:hypothetical protein
MIMAQSDTNESLTDVGDVTCVYTSSISLTHQNKDPNHILRPPYKQIRNVDEDLQRRIAVYITQVVGGRVADMARRLPNPSYFAGKFRIRNGGDTFRTQEACQRSGTLARRNCYVRVC